MAIKTNTATINKLYFGSTPIKKVYSGSTLIGQATTYYYTAGTENVAGQSGGTGGTVTEGASYVTLATTSTMLAREIGGNTTDMIELTGKTTVYIDWEGVHTGVGTKTCRIVVSDRIDAYSVYDAQTSLTPPFTRTTTSLSVSNLSGDYHIRVHAHKATGRGVGTITLTVHNVGAE